MKASASTLHGWEMGQQFPFWRTPPLNPPQREGSWTVLPPLGGVRGGQAITEEDIDAENVAVRQIVTCTLPGDMI